MTGRLLSVNVGLPQDLTWHGRTVYTAVWKKPVEGPVQVRWLNIDGDGQGDLAGHGGENRAVFVYQIESYQYWQDQLSRDDFTCGQFGENFTVTGLGDDQVCIGDRYRIGEAVFEVTQPRVTCYRVGIRMDDPQIPALLVSHHRPGFYLRVLREGAVQAGDDIVPVATGPQAMTVAETDALLYLPGHPRKQLLRALQIPALSPGWKASFQAMLDEPEAGGAAEGNAGLTAVSPPPAWPGFRPLTVTAVERETDSIVSVQLADPGGAAVPAALPGQFLVLRLPVSQGQPPLLRSYSLSGPPGAATYRVSVKREPHGAGSQFIHSRVRAGDVLEAAAPRGTFTLRPGQGPVLLISAGVGATPVLAMLHALAAARSGRDIWWLHGARNRAEEPFAAESRSLLATLAGGHRHVCYSHPGPDDVQGRDYQTTGRLSPAVLADLDLPRSADAYICGPAGFMADVSAALVGLGVDGSRVHTEIFGAAPAQTPGIAAAVTRPPAPARG
jgi:ferredoxin-NADP reductase/MOSC domain-containing protein YiiM